MLCPSGSSSVQSTAQRVIHNLIFSYSVIQLGFWVAFYGICQEKCFLGFFISECWCSPLPVLYVLSLVLTHYRLSLLTLESTLDWLAMLIVMHTSLSLGNKLISGKRKKCYNGSSADSLLRWSFNLFSLANKEIVGMSQSQELLLGRGVPGGLWRKPWYVG